MARYIDADGLIKKVFPYDVVDKKCYTINAKTIYEAIQEAPTADVVPRSEVEILEVRLEMAEEANKGLSELYHTDTDALVEARRKTEVEVAREIFEEVNKIRLKEIHKCETLREQENEVSQRKYWEGGYNSLRQLSYWLAALKKKYVPDTNVGNITAAEAIAKLIFDNYTMSRDLKTAVKLIEGWQEEFGKLKDAKIIEGLQPIEAITSVHMLTLEKYKDTNAPTKVSSGEICVICGESVPEGRQVCGMCETGQEFLKKRKE